MALIEADIVGWWEFDEGSGTSIADSATTPHDGTLTTGGGGWVTGGPTNSPDGVNFDGSATKVLISNDFDLSDGTILVWCNINDFEPTGALERVIADMGDLGGEMSLMTTQRDATDDFRGRTRIGGSDRDVDANSKSTATLYHVAFGWKSSSTDDAVEIWVNDVSEGSSTADWGTITDTNNNLYIGCRADGTTKFLDGKVFQVVLCNRKLTTAEIGEIYNSGSGITYSSLFGGGAASTHSLLTTGVGD